MIFLSLIILNWGYIWNSITPTVLKWLPPPVNVVGSDYFVMKV